MTDASKTGRTECVKEQDGRRDGHGIASCGLCGLAAVQVKSTTLGQMGTGLGQMATGAWQGLQQTGRAIAEFLLPPVCLACGAALDGHNSLCGSCWQRVNFICNPLCDRTGLPLPYDSGGTMISAEALRHPPVYDRARAVAHYDGVMSELIRSFKYADRHDLRHLFARWLIAAAGPLLPATDFLVPVPLNRLKLLARRFNQSALLGQDLARSAELPFEPLALARIRRTEPQVGKTPDQRRRNVAGAFAPGPGWNKRLVGKNVLLVDDVITTGATINACAKALKRAGARRVDVVALAKTTGAPM